MQYSRISRYPARRRSSPAGYQNIQNSRISGPEYPSSRISVRPRYREGRISGQVGYINWYPIFFRKVNKTDNRSITIQNMRTCIHFIVIHESNEWCAFLLWTAMIKFIFYVSMLSLLLYRCPSLVLSGFHLNNNSYIVIEKLGKRRGW